MSYKVVFTDEARKDLKKLDKHTATLIFSWIEKNLQGCKNPRARGKALTSNRSGQWRYRIGDYRLICLIKDDELIILALSVGHRREVYN
ncbi:MAG: type II toxin-antitoxin system RelE/ParE family toxin [Oscillospiraceae bacterium]|nr:type II toxin-antitoxin system RelE/ParE family toxin [Oscillospiraceae bacterium]